jgi:ParB family chromosome partitioning protein
MSAAILPIPLDAIAADALARDRAAHDAAALEELKLSIATHGLRMPVEVFELAEPEGELRFGLISGFRRLAAFRALRDEWGLKQCAEIPAFVREPQSVTEAMIAMVEENAIRAEVSPWEQALVAVTAWRRRLFDTVDAAVNTLYQSLNSNKRQRLRAIAHLAEEMEGALTAPETIPQQRLLRLAAAVSRGYADLIHHTLAESRNREPEHQWRLLQRILAECEDPAIPDPRPELGHRDRPRRTYELPRRAIRIRRERTEDGWCLHFTGKDAHDGTLIDRVFDEIEFLFSPA